MLSVEYNQFSLCFHSLIQSFGPSDTHVLALQISIKCSALNQSGLLAVIFGKNPMNLGFIFSEHSRGGAANAVATLAWFAPILWDVRKREIHHRLLLKQEVKRHCTERQQWAT